MQIIHLTIRLIEKYQRNQNYLHMVFIDLDKTYDKVYGEILWKILEKKGPNNIQTPSHVLYDDDILIFSKGVKRDLLRQCLLVGVFLGITIESF
ncbi:hypothetical protein Lal_00004101 [Lupinus albus]|nr:hypothetical protein Lal_00004101 [Lupinus albus]